VRITKTIFLSYRSIIMYFHNLRYQITLIYIDQETNKNIHQKIKLTRFKVKRSSNLTYTLIKND